MAHFVEESLEGKTTRRSKPPQTLEEWLKKNRLKKLAPYFDDEEVVLSDLKTYSDTIIDTMWEYEAVKSLKLGPLYQERFKNAVRRLQFESKNPESRGSVNAQFGQIHRIVISTKEQELMNQLESQ